MEAGAGWCLVGAGVGLVVGGRGTGSRKGVGRDVGVYVLNALVGSEEY